MNEKLVNRVGWFASIMAAAMYFSYIDQIIRNIHGNPGSIILPITTIINCSAWTIYGWHKTKKDWPIIMCNIPGVFLGIITIITVIVFS